MILSSKNKWINEGWAGPRWAEVKNRYFRGQITHVRLRPRWEWRHLHFLSSPLWLQRMDAEADWRFPKTHPTACWFGSNQIDWPPNRPFWNRQEPEMPLDLQHKNTFNVKTVYIKFVCIFFFKEMSYLRPTMKIALDCFKMDNFVPLNYLNQCSKSLFWSCLHQKGIFEFIWQNVVFYFC